MGLVGFGCVALSGVGGQAHAQGFDPPPGPATAAPPPPAAPQPQPEAAPIGENPADRATPPARTLADNPFGNEEPAPLRLELPASDAPTNEPPDPRRAFLREGSGLLGATGLSRVMSAHAGAPGTFRFSLLTGFYSGSGFLCPECPDENFEGAGLEDEVDRVTANLFLSATPLPFLEAYASIFSNSTSTTRPVDQLKQVVGDWLIGAKVFLPSQPTRIFDVAAAMDFGFATGSGSVGVTGIDAVNLGMRAIGSVDLSRRAGSPLPVRVHANLGYLFNNSGALVDDFETAQGRPVDRVERFSLDVDKVDFLQMGLGVEGLFEVARPFLEWSIDVPSNRQNFRCDRGSRPPGEACLADRAQFSTTPSRLSAGARVAPWTRLAWWPAGVSLTGALDIATGGASDFTVEVAPEVPWTLWLGAAFAADTRPPPPVAPPPPPVVQRDPDLLIHGQVVELDTQSAIGDAQIRFEGRQLTGFISRDDGRFVSGALEPGRYTLQVSAEGYEAGTCSVDLQQPEPELPLDPLGLDPAHAAPSAEPPVASAAAESGADAVVQAVTCTLKPVPKVSNLYGRVADASSGQPVGNAVARITDVLGRFLELRVDEAGAFGFLNIPPGVASVSIEADGYLRSVSRVEVQPLQELNEDFVLTPIPSQSGIRREGQRLTLLRPITFEESSSTLSPQALASVQELAPYLLDNASLGRVEVQGHVAEPGPAGERLSSERAGAVRDALILHGVPDAMLTARGYGANQPLDTSGNEQARKRNTRIVFQLINADGSP